MKSTRKAFVFSLLSMLLCVSMLIGTTFAWFTDTATSSNNRIVAGNLDVDLVMHNGTEYVSIAGGSGDIFNTAAIAQNKPASLWEPGKTQVVYLGVQNKGNLAIKYNIILDVTDTDTTDGVNLADVLDFAIIDGATYETTYANWAAVTNATSTTGVIGTLMGDSNPARITAASNGTLDEIRNGTQNETDYFVLAVHMQETAGNEYQGKEIVIDLSVVATQKDAEEDSFGPDYDEPATLPEVPVAIHDIVTQTIAAAPVTAATSTATVAATEITSTDATSKVPADTTVTLTGYTASGEDKTDSVTGLTRTIETTDSSVTSLTLDIGYKATVTTTANDVVVSTEEYAVHTFGNVVENIVNVGTGLTNVKVTHGTTQMTKATNTTAKADGTYYYDSETGKLYIWSSTYSEYSVSWDAPDYVASVGSTGYTSLDAALAAAAAGDTVTLLKSVSGQAAIMVYKNLTINGNGNTITFSGDRGIRVAENDVDLTVKNVTLVGGSNFERAIQVDSDMTGAKLTIDNVNATATYYTVNICANTTVDVTINNSTIIGWGAINHHGNFGTITINNSTLVGINNYSSPSNSFATIVIDGNSLFTPGSIVENNSVIINGSKIVAKENGTCTQNWISFQYGANNNSATVSISSDTTIVSDTENGTDKTAVFYMTGEGNTIVMSLTDEQKAAITANDFKVVDNGDGTCTISNTPNIYYYWPTSTGTEGENSTFAKPFTANWLMDGEFIDLIDNVTLSRDVMVPFTTGSFTLNLKEYTISGEGKVVLPSGEVSVISDSEGLESLFKFTENVGVAPNPTVVGKDNGNGTWTYQVKSVIEGTAEPISGGIPENPPIPMP